MVLYGSAFVASHDQSTLDYVYQQFEKDFGMRPYLIRDNSWRFESDATTNGEPLWGTQYLCSRRTDRTGIQRYGGARTQYSIRDREDGNFYRWSWHQILQNPMVRIVLVETWNEMHEGTDICESVEFGRQYIDLTREYVQRFKEGRTDVPRIILQHPNPLFRPASDEGKEFKDAKSVSVVLGEQGESKGVWLVRGNEDGVVEQTTIDGKSAVRNKKSDLSYIYFKVADPFFFNGEQTLTLEYTYFDEGFHNHVLQYDSHQENIEHSGAYKGHQSVPCGQSGEWKTARIKLEDARFVNRQNAGSDFRFAIFGGQMAIHEVRVIKE